MCYNSDRNTFFIIMSEENMTGTRGSKMLGAVIAIAAVAGIIGYFAKGDAVNNTETIQTTATETKTTETGAVTETTVTTKTTESKPGETGTTTDTTVTTKPAEGTSAYKDGSYKATGSYTSPAGEETIDISITLKDDAIVAATFTGNAVNPGSKNWQGKFSEGYEAVVVGKKIDELSLSVVNGSSLTPKGFMDAVADIKVEAKS